MPNRRCGILTFALLLAFAGCSENAGAPAETAAAGEAVAPRAPSMLEWSQRCTAEPPDAAELRELLAAARYDELEARLQRVHEAYWADPACEGRVWESSAALMWRPSQQLDSWIAAHEDAWAALAIRGGRRVEDGYRARGGALSKDVTERQWEGMRDAFAAARADLERALALEPRAIFAAGYWIKMLRAGGDKREVAAVLDRTLAVDPANYGVRRRAMEALNPRWGGSLRAMESVAKQAQSESERNPRLRLLPGFPHAARGEMAWARHEWDAAIAGYESALRYGGYPDWYRSLCKLLSRQDQYRQLVRVAKDWLEYSPDEAEAHFYRATGYLFMRSMERARADLDRAIELAPRYTRAYQTRSLLRARSGDLEGAANDLRRAQELSPEDAWTLQQLGPMLAERLGRPEEAVSVYRKLVALDAKSADAWFRLGSLLHAQGDPEAKSALEHYVRIAQGDSTEAARLARAQRMLDPEAAEVAEANDATESLPALSRVMAPADSR
jgi:tetratricopeptide (TPR) repeat protein